MGMEDRPLTTSSESTSPTAGPIWNPVSTLIVNANLGLLNTEIQDTWGIDVLDRTNGRSDLVTIKNAASYANCVVSAQGYAAVLRAICSAKRACGHTARANSQMRRCPNWQTAFMASSSLRRAASRPLGVGACRGVVARVGTGRVGLLSKPCRSLDGSFMEGWSAGGWSNV